MARTIQPFATLADGDVLYAVTIDEVDNPQLSVTQLGIIASELAWDAVLSSVPVGDPPISVPARLALPQTVEEFAGVYELGPGTRATVRSSSGKLTIESPNGGSYIPAGSAVELSHLSETDFLIPGARRDFIRFTRENGRVTGLLSILGTGLLLLGDWSLPAGEHSVSGV